MSSSWNGPEVNQQGRPVVLVTGGAGYVGAHTCLRLSEAGFAPVVFDNLSNGHAAFVQWGPLVQGDVRDAAKLDAVFAAHRPVAVLHFAALIEVAASVTSPADFYDVNVAGSLAVIGAARRAGVKAMVFSSTCATFGAPVRMPMDETHPQAPINPYGRTKLIVEQALADLDRYSGFRSVALRYFNAAGADPEGRIGERHDPETHVIPLLIDAALGRRAGFSIYGTDYDTPDGTAVRDYVHVLDLADAHVAALRRLLNGGATTTFNLGAGVGSTVRDVIGAVERVSGATIKVTETGRREGDSPALVADNRKAVSELDWRPRYGLNEIVATAWAWHNRQGL
jgi:UDP-glucose 4-epimerase